MAAPTGNQFWKLRSKHGRDKLFASSELLWDAACEYFEWCDNNPLKKTEQRKQTVIVPKGFEGDMGDLYEALVDLPVGRPYTLEGLCLYLDCSISYFRVFKARFLKEEEGKEYSKEELKLREGFATVISRIEQTCYRQKFDGAAVGNFNANIIARDLGLRDKTELSTPEDGSAFNVTLKLE
jgi:hypothetical protein